MKGIKKKGKTKEATSQIPSCKALGGEQEEREDKGRATGSSGLAKTTLQGIAKGARRRGSADEGSGGKMSDSNIFCNAMWDEDEDEDEDDDELHQKNKVL